MIIYNYKNDFIEEETKENNKIPYFKKKILNFF